MFALLQAATPGDFDGVWKMVTGGGSLGLLAVIIVLLIKLAPRMADRIADSHVEAIKQVSDAHTAACTAFANANLVAVKAFTDDAREGRSLFRSEQQDARTFNASLIAAERAACEARSVRLEARMDQHTNELRTIGTGLTALLQREKGP